MPERSLALSPVVVEVLRGDRVESESRGSMVVVDERGITILAIGNIDHPVFPRSTWKPLQAIPLLSSGAAERYRLSDAELSLACASHYGEALHTRSISRWLKRLGIPPNALHCGIQLSMYGLSLQTVQQRMRRRLTPVNNNCSGKHAAFLTLAKHRRYRRSEYLEPRAALQKEISECLSEVCQFDVDSLAVAVDGCAAPTYALPLRNLAWGFARFSRPTQMPSAYRRAPSRLFAAIHACPLHFSGSGTFPSVLASKAMGAVVVKPGAEGTYGAFIPALGWGVAVKIDDGTLRAAECLIAALITELFKGSEISQVASAVVQSTISGSAGQTTGKMVPEREIADALRYFRGTART